MKFAQLLAVIAAGVIIASGSYASAQAPAAPPAAKKTPDAATPAPSASSPSSAQCGMMDGCQLMTDAERKEFQEKMKSLKTPEERQAFRQEHHKLMQARAKERGMTLPDMPAGGMMGQGHMMKGHAMGAPPGGAQPEQGTKPSK